MIGFAVFLVVYIIGTSAYAGWISWLAETNICSGKVPLSGQEAGKLVGTLARIQYIAIFSDIILLAKAPCVINKQALQTTLLEQWMLCGATFIAFALVGSLFFLVASHRAVRNVKKSPMLGQESPLSRTLDYSLLAMGLGWLLAALLQLGALLL